MDVKTFDRIGRELVSPEHFKLYTLYIQPEGPVGSLTVSVDTNNIVELQAVPRGAHHAMLAKVEALGGKVSKNLTLLTESHAPQENAFLAANGIPPEPPNLRGYDARSISNVSLSALQQAGLVHPEVAKAIAADVGDAVGRPMEAGQIHFGPTPQMESAPVFQPDKAEKQLK